MTITDPAVGENGTTGGRTRISPRALDRIVSTVTAEAFGSDPKRTSVTVTDESGTLNLVITTPVKVPSLLRVNIDRSLIARTGGTVLDRAEAAQASIMSRVSELTGYSIGRVSIRLNGADVIHERRVK
ncbi:hypothetical protein [Cryobacterium sp. PH31-O1]|uniref:hypothetical protein n=1 Tax=Cryobacterium sp. PH31-O1 TaxID=3046306 RepID=UPI0024B96FC1|nr:hypothetical protein [Cryobacterium sp. PH31-O1]MDJ0337910.1 hypothetical protein [Cryobacterium sp. PH31-O1]